MTGPDLGGRYADVVPRPASSILLVRNGAAGLEVFMVKRHHQIDFASGAMVFPGGKVEASDSDAAARAAAIGADSLDDVGLGFRISALREAFEETGVLIAIDANGRLPERARVADLKARYVPALDRGELTMGELARVEDLRYPLDRLVPFAHWVTPAVMAKRFDTPFYIIEAPSEQLEHASHDGREAVESIWIDPTEAVRRADAGEVTMVFATRMNLVKLAPARTVSAAIEAARTGPIVKVLPQVFARDGRRMIDIPADAGFGTGPFDVGAA